MKTKLICITAIVLALVLCAGCAPAGKAPTLNGTKLRDFTLVYDAESPDYCQRAAEFIAAQILERTGLQIPVCEADSGTFEHEILVGETDRALSAALDADTKGVEFALLADEDHIALEGDYFVIAAAAYYFVETYITGATFHGSIPTEATVCMPITEKANNFIFLIGDGMGPVQTQLFETMTPSDAAPYYDGENIFYGNMLPYQGVIHTDSLSGLTDSAAAGTALACGYKTYNSYVGRDENGNDVQSLTELAADLGMATAVMSTDKLVGATPAAFSAHAKDRDDSTDISRSQQRMMKQYGTVLDCGLDGTKSYQTRITDMLTRLEADEDGFFLMYEEGHIDKHSHKHDLVGTFDCMVRFNQAIGVFMEYAFYHQDTFLLITADHETGGLTPDGTGHYGYTAEAHSNVDVPIFAYGQGAEAYDGYCQENNEVPKVIAALWGVDDFGDN